MICQDKNNYTALQPQCDLLETQKFKGGVQVGLLAPSHPSETPAAVVQVPPAPLRLSGSFGRIPKEWPGIY